MYDFLALTRSGLRMPAGAGLPLGAPPGPEAVRPDWRVQGRAVEAAATTRWKVEMMLPA
jgi:hypothetical protein